MRTLKPARIPSSALSLFLVIVAAVTVLLLAGEPNQTSRDARIKATAQLSAEPNISQWLTMPGAKNSCAVGLIYTSLPPKCRTIDGTFVELNEWPSNVLVIPTPK